MPEKHGDSDHDNSDLVETAVRRKWLLRKRQAGMTMREIASAAEEEFGEERLPKGWDERYVSKDIRRALDRVRSELDVQAREYQDVQISRLRALLEELWPMTQWHTVEIVEDGEKFELEKPPEVRAVDRVLVIMDRLAKHYGVDKPDELPDQNGGDNIFKKRNRELLEGSSS